MEFISLKKHPNPKEELTCMIVLDIRDFKKRVTLCIMAISLRGDQNMRDLRNKWVYDIRFFKEKCQEKKLSKSQKIIASSIDDDPYIQRRKQEILLKRREENLIKIEEKDQEVKDKKTEKNVEKVAKMALQVYIK